MASLSAATELASTPHAAFVSAPMRIVELHAVSNLDSFFSLSAPQRAFDSAFSRYGPSPAYLRLSVLRI